ncbi:MAG: acetolactate synthase [Planctomycetaceae bacterium]|jgi:acetolactate synthase-1/2/3 large subunit|nr:acetolactate synthase [Planctomycetaceae bacterium]
MSRLSGAQFIADSLAANRVSHVFFVPAIMNQTLAELDLRTDIKRIMTHGEKAAVYMADGYARASGRPGVCFAQCIGAANLAAALRDPFLACSPMVAFTGGPYPATRHRHAYQQIEDFPLFKPLTKYSASVDQISRLPDVLRQAFRAATTGTPGPAHIELQGHMGELELEVDELPIIVQEQFSQVPALRPSADPQAVAEVVRRLREAERPVIVAGGGVRTSGAGPELVELAQRLAIPVATSMNAKDVIPGNHALNVGVPGLYCRKSANQVVLEADLVFFVGSHTGSQVTFKWQVPPPGTPVIQLDINPEELGRHYPNEVSLLADAKVALRQLIEATDPSTAARPGAWVARAETLAHEWREEFAPLMNSEAVPMRPERLCRELTQLMPADTLLVSETGHSGMWTGGMVDLNKPGQGYLRAAGSLGWGLPAALGAKLALPERPVLLFSGDGGFWYHLSELETAVRWNINAVLLINNNRALNQQIDGYTRAYGGQLRGKHAELWQFSDVSFAELARTMGADGFQVRKPGELSGALDKAFSSKKPCVVEVMTEMTALAPLAFLYEDEPS